MSELYEIQLTRGLVALVDAEDWKRLSRFKWHATSRKNRSQQYATRLDSNHRRIYMHKEIISPPDGYFTDHINGDGLDNRRANLRFCTRS